MDDKTNAGTGLASIVFVVFLVLKLIGVIDWSWWWVTAPLWGGAAVFIAVFVVGGLIIYLINRDRS